MRSQFSNVFSTLIFKVGGRGSDHFKIEKNSNNNLNTNSRETWFSQLGWKRGSELSLKIKAEKNIMEL